VFSQFCIYVDIQGLKNCGDYKAITD